MKERSGLLADVLPPDCIVKCWGDERIIERGGKPLARFDMSEAMTYPNVTEFLREKLGHLFVCDVCGDELDEGSTCVGCTEKQVAEILSMRSSF